MIIIELKRPGDFDIWQTHSVWINPDLDKKSFDVSVLGDFGDDREPDNAVKQLKSHGFRKISTQDVEIGGNL
jgi:hypothetical protein